MFDLLNHSCIQGQQKTCPHLVTTGCCRASRQIGHFHLSSSGISSAESLFSIFSFLLAGFDEVDALSFPFSGHGLRRRIISGCLRGFSGTWEYVVDSNALLLTLKSFSFDVGSGCCIGLSFELSS